MSRLRDLAAREAVSCEAVSCEAVRLEAVRRDRRRLLTAAAVPLLGLAAGGCTNLRGDVPAHVYYELDDQAQPQRDAGPRVERRLLVTGTAGSTLYDSVGLAYSRAPGARSYYQFASWSEAPAQRVMRLAQRRLAALGVFQDVAGVTSAVRGDWLLELQLDQMYHDDLSPPGNARIDVFAELVDWRERRALARRPFSVREPLAQENAAAAAAAFNRALTRLLDELADWVLTQARAAA
ncbi:MAG: ABC-type transport auxiliary lipoprotein family protein [Burkholderiaceae bacterium]